MMRILLVLLLAICLPFQGLGQAVDRISAPAHFHAAGAVHEHAHDQAHGHAGVLAIGPLIGHHAHALTDDDVIYVTDAHDTPSQGGSGAKTPPVDGVLLADGWAFPPSTSVERVFTPEVGVLFSSHVGGPLRRPPRRSALS